MKKTILSVLLVLVFLCFTASVGAGSFEWVKDPHPAQQNGCKSPQQRDLSNTDTAEIYNVLTGAIQDDNFNLFCVSYNMAMYITVPPEGASFYFVIYHRIKGVEETEWDEWTETARSSFFYLSPEDAALGHIEFRNGFWKEEGVSFGPSEAEFKTEIYDPNNELLDVFVSSSDNGYWPPKLESEDYDDESSVYTPTPTPTPCGETPLPTSTPTPTPEECEPVEMVLNPEKMKLAKGETKSEIVTVFCDNGSPAEGILVSASVAHGKKKIFVTPSNSLTDENGQAAFTITGEKKGRAEVVFSTSEGITDSLTVIVK